MTRPDGTPRHPAGRTCGAFTARTVAAIALLIALHRRRTS